MKQNRELNGFSVFMGGWLLALNALLILGGGRGARCTCPGDGKRGGFATINGSHLIVDGKVYYGNGFNAYWLMYEATDPASRVRVTDTFRNAQVQGLTVARTWAFSDGEKYRPLQIVPGYYNEQTFRGLDFVVAEAKKFGIKLILALVNNWPAFGGKKKYAEWAKGEGTPADDFYTDPHCKEMYKNHVLTIFNRRNTFTGVLYMDDPTILGWELMNEPRCNSDPSGKTLGAWITEMAAYVKSIDRNHLQTVGTEGFYGDSTPDRKQYCNPNNFPTGSDFIAHHKPDTIDFVTVHCYPDQWLPKGAPGPDQIAFLKKWVQCHIEDSQNPLKKPLLFTEFGNDRRMPGYTPELRQQMYRTVYDAIYNSAKVGGAASAALFWQVLTKEQITGFADGTEIVFQMDPEMTGIISEQSKRLADVIPGCEA